MGGLVTSSSFWWRRRWIGQQGRDVRVGLSEVKVALALVPLLLDVAALTLWRNFCHGFTSHILFRLMQFLITNVMLLNPPLYETQSVLIAVA